jgi:hypothetical protein
MFALSIVGNNFGGLSGEGRVELSFSRKPSGGVVVDDGNGVVVDIGQKKRNEER